MITLADRNRLPVRLRRRLEDLAARFPVGMHVRHCAGWTGKVVPDFAGNLHGLGLDGEAHCLTGEDGAAVCVEATINGYLATVWYRPRVLQPVGEGTPAPAPRPSPRSADVRTRRRTRRAA